MALDRAGLLERMPKLELKVLANSRLGTVERPASHRASPYFLMMAILLCFWGMSDKCLRMI